MYNAKMLMEKDIEFSFHVKPAAFLLQPRMCAVRKRLPSNRLFPSMNFEQPVCVLLFTSNAYQSKQNRELRKVLKLSVDL